ncbi:uncharacterized protein K460DRAFT_369266 [Cucurbitaria berberidis CBS 394.84]|uniref:Azaphilone pigments biosynthesis cluster protein L N-terminal domain-containing protein n=1 Tax=Cucurbitaria berberidis CBS 394.84 TaxID=1168544 RepID=A0A9P4GEA7_9PLEO|nr:uncharacterized protein K460DRAFT_369266 [Cucurbitaria berberidis CBS 394.84]KAF1844398.1 hypothetical protein K460DRAFT_369266 [Cucurbitaria berberidis CBS 394.84]
MAEIAGTAVGIVSLSIQICERLVWYTNNVKDAREKAENLRTGLNQLSDVLEALEACIDRLRGPVLVTAARDSVIACANAMETIKNKLGSCSTSNKSKLRIGMGRLATRLIFLFKESDVLYLRGMVSDILQTWQVALHALQLRERIYQKVR